MDDTLSTAICALMEIWRNPVPADVAEWFDQLAIDDPQAAPVLIEAADLVRRGYWEAAEAQFEAALAAECRSEWQMRPTTSLRA